MITWTESHQQSPRRGTVTLKSGEYTGPDWEGLYEALIEAWDVIIAELNRECAEKTDREWEVLDWEIWPDTGCVICIPGLRSRKRRIENIFVSVHFLFIEAIWHALPTEPVLFEERHKELMDRIAEVIEATARIPTTSEKLRTLRQRRPVDVRILWYSDNETTKTLSL